MVRARLNYSGHSDLRLVSSRHMIFSIKHWYKFEFTWPKQLPSKSLNVRKKITKGKFSICWMLLRSIYNAIMTATSHPKVIFVLLKKWELDLHWKMFIVSLNKHKRNKSIWMRKMAVSRTTWAKANVTWSLVLLAIYIILHHTKYC